MDVKITPYIDNVSIDEQEHRALIYLQLPRQICFRPLRQRRSVLGKLAMWYLGRETVGVKAMNMGPSFQNFRLRSCSYCRNEWSIMVKD